MIKNKLLKILCIAFFSILVINTSYAVVETIEDENIFQNTPGVIIKDNGVKNVEDGMDEMSSGRVQNLIVEVLSGKNKGKQYEATYTVMAKENSNFQFDVLKEGDKIYLTIDERMDDPLVYVSGIQRHNSLIILALVFLLSIVVIGRKQGLKTIVSLLVTILIVFFWAIPRIIDGASPLWIAIVVSSVITIFTYLIISGPHKKTIIAILGTIGGLILSAIVVFVFGYFSRLSGLNEESMYLSFLPQGIEFNLVEIIFAGIIIGALGACMDMSMSIASALEEITKGNPFVTQKLLFKSGMNIGKDVMGTNTNTLILAYVGSSLTILIVYMSYGMSFSQIADVEVISEAIIRSLAGSIGLVGVIPLTALISSILYTRKSDNEVNEKEEEI